MKYIVLSFLLLGIVTSLFSQDKRLANQPFYDSQSVTFTNPDGEEDEVEYAYLGKYDNNKPVVVFIGEITPMPAIVCFQETGEIQLQLPFDELLLREAYNILIVSNPGIPAVADASFINWEEQQYQLENGTPPVSYFKNEYLEYHLAAISAAIQDMNSLRGKKSELIWLGHRKGARIATKMAGLLGGKALVYLCEDPFASIFRIIGKEEGMTEEDAKAKWRGQFGKNSETIQIRGEPARTWLSYSDGLYDDIEKLKMPVLFGQAELFFDCNECEQLMPEMEKRGKRNCKEVVFSGVNEAFLDGSGVNSGWEEVLREVKDWLETLK